MAPAHSTVPVSWRAHYEPGVPHGLPKAEHAFGRLLSEAAAAAPGQTALLYFNRRYSYAELDGMAARAEATFRRAGLAPGERVAIALPSAPTAWALILGAMRAGGSALLLPAGATAEALTASLRAHPARFVLAEADDAAARAAAPLGPPGARWLSVHLGRDLPRLLRLLAALRGLKGPRPPGRALARWERLPRGSGPAPAVDPGVTALECLDRDGKLHAFSHAHLVSGALQIRAWLADTVPGEDFWLPLLGPRSSLAVVLVLGAAVLARAKVALLPYPDAEALVDLSGWLPIAFVFSDAAMVARLAQDQAGARADWQAVRAWIVSDRVDPETRAGFEAATGLAICQAFGPAMAAGLLTCNPVNGRRMADSLGLLMPGISARRVPSGRSSDDGLTQVELRGPNLPGEGWRHPELRLTASTEGYLFELPEG